MAKKTQKTTETVVTYVPKTLEDATKLFKKFERMNLKNLNKEEFFRLFEEGNGEVGFCIDNGALQVCEPHLTCLFDFIFGEI